MNKYSFTGETKTLLNGVVLKRIKRNSDGLVGGWVESESNLSQQGNCFVYEDAKVFGNARVYGNAEVFGNARVSENARVFGNAQVYGDAEVFSDAMVYEYARVFGNAWVYGNTRVFGDAKVFGNARVYGDAKIFGNARISGQSSISCGLIDKTPLYIQGLKHAITVTKSHIYIGCEHHTIEYWRKNIKQIGLKYDYSEEEIKKVIVMLKAALKAVKC